LSTTTVAKFAIERVQYLDPTGKPLTKNLPEFTKDKDLLRSMYRNMFRLRAFDAKAYALQRTGNMGTYPASLGQEAIGIGYGLAMKKEDVLVPYYRSTGGLLMHGVSMLEIFLYWGGDERGSDFQVARQDFPIAVPIATQCLHATGVATAIKYRKQQRAVVTEIGEGGTSEGDFYEAINVAGIWGLGVVFFINNNQWAISVPSEIQTNCETYAQKGIAAGIESVQVDGNDILAVYDVANKAFEKARAGKGATLIEAVSYRLCDHTTADDASRYRSKDELEKGWDSEPIKRLRAYLESLKAWSDKDEEALQKEVAEEIDAAVHAYKTFPAPKPEDMFDTLYAELPKHIQQQRADAIARGAKHTGGHH
jgi:2-oxoisovalerate dehydrogenase E1 component alpha subunit